MQHATYNAAYLTSVAQAVTAYVKLIEDCAEALLADAGYAESYYTGDVCYFDVLDFVRPSYSGATQGDAPETEVENDAYNIMAGHVHAKMLSITGLALMGDEGYIGEEAIPAALAEHIGWTAWAAKTA